MTLCRRVTLNSVFALVRLYSHLLLPGTTALKRMNTIGERNVRHCTDTTARAFLYDTLSLLHTYRIVIHLPSAT